MVRPYGFDHFYHAFSNFKDQYVIIGGGAASIFMEDQLLNFRATKDVDLVILIQSKEFNKEIIDYVKNGQYQEQGATANQPKYYRFTKPKESNYPKVIEIFARNELGLELLEGQHIIPIQNESAEYLSAILLDDDYFNLIRTNITESRSGIPIINSVANICLKAGAYSDLLKRSENSDIKVDKADIQKHLKDIWRLSMTLTGKEVINLDGKPAHDLKISFSKLKTLTSQQFKQLMENNPGANREAQLEILMKVFASSIE